MTRDQNGNGMHCETQAEHTPCYNNARNGCQDSKKEFTKPIAAVMPLVGPLNSKEIAALSDDQLAEYLNAHGYQQAKEAVMAALDHTAE